MGTRPYQVYQILQASIRHRFSLHQPGEQILILFVQQPLIQSLLLLGQRGQLPFNEGQQQQIQFAHAATAVPGKFLVLNIC